MTKRNVTPRGVCPGCGKKGLGNRYPHPEGGTYRQCVYCGEVDRRTPAEAAA